MLAKGLAPCKARGRNLPFLWSAISALALALPLLRRRFSGLACWNAKDKLYVNLETVKQGYGDAYLKCPLAQQRMDEFRAADNEAREAKRGLWGDTPAAQEQPKAVPQPIFITASGMMYHLECCRFLANSNVPVSLGDAKKRGFEPCLVCNPLKKRSWKMRC